jgi:hypothetical protein
MGVVKKGCRYSLLQYKLSKRDRYLSEYLSHHLVLEGPGHHAVGEQEGLGVHHHQLLLLLPLPEPAQVRPDDQDGVQEAQLPRQDHSRLQSVVLVLGVDKDENKAAVILFKKSRY